MIRRALSTFATAKRRPHLVASSDRRGAFFWEALPPSDQASTLARSTVNAGDAQSPWRRWPRSIDENLQRANLTVLQESQALKRRKEIYEVLHPEAKHGAQGGGRDGKGTRLRTETDNMSFSEDAASKTGKSARTVRRNVALASSISEDVQEQIADSPIADSKVELAALAKVAEDDKHKGSEESESRRTAAVLRALPSRQQSSPIGRVVEWKLSDSSSTVRAGREPARRRHAPRAGPGRCLRSSTVIIAGNHRQARPLGRRQ